MLEGEVGQRPSSIYVALIMGVSGLGACPDWGRVQIGGGVGTGFGYNFFLDIVDGQ